MKALWIHWKNAGQLARGAELSDHYWQACAPRGVEVVECTARGGDLPPADVYILGNFFRQKSLVRQLRDQGAPFVVVQHGR